MLSSRDALLADSDLRAHRPCHRRDGTAGTPELVHRRHHRRAASLSVRTTQQPEDVSKLPTQLDAMESSPHCDLMYSRLPRAAAQHQSPVPSQMDANGRCLISRAAPINKGPPKVPLVTLPSPNGSTRLSRTSDIGPDPLILGSDSTGLQDSDDRLHSGLVESLLANTLRRADVAQSVSTQAPNGASRAVGTHHGPTRIHAPTTAYAIGGTATLAQGYSIISATAAARTLPPG